MDSGNFLSNTTLQSLLALKYYDSVNPIFLTKENYKIPIMLLIIIKTITLVKSYSREYTKL